MSVIPYEALAPLLFIAIFSGIALLALPLCAIVSRWADEEEREDKRDGGINL